MVARPRSSNFSATASKSSSPESTQTRTSPIVWFGGEPGEIAHESLPYIREAEARELIERAADLLVADHGYIRAAERPRQKKSTAGEETAQHGAADWQYLCDRIHAGEALHDFVARPRRQAGRLGHGAGRGRQLPARADGELERAARCAMAGALQRNPAPGR